MKLRLTREQRARLFKLERVPISGEAPCPLEAGQNYPLSANLSIQVEGIRWRRDREGVRRWGLQYRLVDKRDRKRLLRRTPGIHAEDFEAIRASFDEYGTPQEPTRDVLRLAAEDSAYTSSMSAAALGDAGEAVDQATQHRFSKEGNNRDGLREARRRERWEAQSLAERVAALEGADLADISRILASIERRVRAAENKLRRAA